MTTIAERPTTQEEEQKKTRGRSKTIQATTGSSIIEIPRITLSTNPYPVSMLCSLMDQGQIDFPEFQRGDVYRLWERQFLWQTALLHLPMAPLLAYRDENEQTLWILDGKQRSLSFHKFLAGQGATFTEASRNKHMPNSRLPLIEPHKRFWEMSDFWQRRYKNYPVLVTVIEGIPDEWLPEVFDIFQVHRELTLGEQFWAKNSKTVQAAQTLSLHPFWTEVYSNKDERMERLTECLSIIAFELCAEPPRVQVRKGELLNLAAGTQDSRITVALIERISRRLTGISHVFRGAGATSRTDIIPIYQAGVYLEQRGYSLEASEGSCLVAWFKRGKFGRWMKNGTMTEEGVGQLAEFNVYASLPHLKKQCIFWEEQMPILLSQGGLVKTETGNGKPWYNGREWTVVSTATVL